MANSGYFKWLGNPEDLRAFDGETRIAGSALSYYSVGNNVGAMGVLLTVLRCAVQIGDLEQVRAVLRNPQLIDDNAGGSFRHNFDGVLSYAIAGQPFNGEVVRLIADRFNGGNLFPEFDPNTENPWAAACEEGWQWLSGQPESAGKDFAVAQMSRNHPDQRTGNDDDVSRRLMDTVVFSYSNSRDDLRGMLSCHDDASLNTVKTLFDKAVTFGRMDVLDILLDPEKCGNAESALMMRRHAGRMRVVDWMLLSKVLAENAGARRGWEAVSRHKSKTNESLLERAPKAARDCKYYWVGPDLFESSLCQDAVTVSLMAWRADVRAKICSAVMANPAVLFETLAGGKDRFICGVHLLSWGGDAMRDWRDENGCGLGHYVVTAAQPGVGSPAQLTAALSALLGAAPEIFTVPDNDGVCASAFLPPAAAAIVERQALERVGRSSGPAAAPRM